MIGRLEAKIKLNNIIGDEPVKFIDQFEEIKRLLLDSLQLMELCSEKEERPEFYDWSFVLLPLGKVIEGLYLEIGKQLSIIDTKVISTKDIGYFYKSKNLDSFKEDIRKKLNGKIQHPENILDSLYQLNSFLIRFRHTPAHYGGRFEKYDQAEAAAKTILYRIKILLEDLLAATLLTLPKPVKPDGYVDLDDIPF